MNSLITALDIDITIPDFSSLSKRSKTLPRHKLAKELEAGSVVIVDSTGLKVYGKDEWHQQKHDVAARRTWRKLHLAVDENHQIVACELTTPETGDPTAVPDLLDQIDTPFDTFIADGAYDGEPVSQAVLKQQPDAQVIVPPHKTAVYSPTGDSQGTTTSESLTNMAVSLGKRKRIMGCAIMPDLPCKESSVVLATR